MLYFTEVEKVQYGSKINLIGADKTAACDSGILIVKKIKMQLP